MSLFKSPDPVKPTPAPTPAVAADASYAVASQVSPTSASPSMVSSGGAKGLTRKPNTQKTSLIGGV